MTASFYARQISRFKKKNNKNERRVLLSGMARLEWSAASRSLRQAVQHCTIVLSQQAKIEMRIKQNVILVEE